MTEQQIPQTPDRDPAGTSAAVSDPLIGMLLEGRYRIIALLARGGMATVYSAHDERLEREVAVKVLHPHLVDSASVVSAFNREARAVARLLHPNIVTVFDQGVVADSAFIVMELVSGKSLREFILRCSPLTLGSSLSLTRQIMTGLDAAHRRGVIHRDIKPENILLSSDGEPKIADFGIAQTINNAAKTSQHTILGTAAYIAPEVITQGSFDARSDLYSVGIILFEMLTGRVPFSGSNPLTVAYAHVNQEVPPPSSLVSWIPAEVDELLSGLTSKDPDNRFATASEALLALQKLESEIPSELLQTRSKGGGSARSQAANATAPLNTPASTAILSPSPTGSSAAGTSPDRAQKRALWKPPANGSVVSAPLTAAKLETLQTEENIQSESKRGLSWLWFILLGVLLLGGGSLLGTWWYSEHGPGAYEVVPTVEGLPLVEATNSIDAAGLTAEAVEVFSDTVEPGLVISSQPIQGKQQHKKVPVRLNVSKGVEMLTVPNLIGKTVAEARQLLISERFSLGEVAQEFSETVPKDQIISSDPQAGKPLRHDSPVKVSVSKGRQPYPVPELVGKPQDSLAEVEKLPLQLDRSFEFSDSVAEGLIISQSVEPGKTLYRGDALKVVISKGPEMVTIPQVRGKNYQTAKKILEDAGFKVQKRAILQGIFNTVRLTEPGEGTKAPRGSTVTIVVI